MSKTILRRFAVRSIPVFVCPMMLLSLAFASNLLAGSTVPPQARGTVPTGHDETIVAPDSWNARVRDSGALATELLHLSDVRMGTLDCGSESTPGSPASMQCAFSTADGARADVVLVRENGRGVLSRIISGRDTLEIALRTEDDPGMAPAVKYAVSLALNDKRLDAEAIVLHRAAGRRPAETVRMVPPEEVAEFAAQVAASDIGVRIVAPLRQLLTHSGGLNRNAVALSRSLELGHTGSIFTLQFTVCTTWCFRTLSGFVCYNCVYGDLCIIGECCGNPYPTLVDLNGRDCGSNPMESGPPEYIP